MVTLSNNIEINATKEKIWKCLWEENNYKEWTQFFNPGSQYKSDWEVNGKTYFLDASGENGMVSTIESLDIPNEVVFSHLGILQNGQEDIESKEVKEWSGAQEKYFLIDLDHGKIKLQAEVQTSQEYEESMNEAFEKGLAKIKEMAEHS